MDSRESEIVGFYHRIGKFSNAGTANEAVMLRYPDGERMLSTGLLYSHPTEEYMEKWEEVDSIDFQAMRQKIVDAIRSDSIFDIQDNRFLITLLNRRIALEEQLYEKQVYICSPLHGDIDGNIYKAIQYCRAAAKMGVIPLAPHTIFTQYLNDDIPVQREKGLHMGQALLKKCDEIWVCGNVVSQGMRAEIQLAKELGKPFRYLNEVNLKMSENQDFQQTEKAAILEEYRASHPVGSQTGSEELFEKIGLSAYPRVQPLQDDSIPYFVMERNELCRFAYSPFAEEKFAVLVQDDFGRLIQNSNGRAFGEYGNELGPLLASEDQLNAAKIMDSLLEYDPKAVMEYEKSDIFQKLADMAQQTGARPFIFSGNPNEAPFISMPAEAEDYLSPDEIALAKKLIAVQEADAAYPFGQEPQVEFEEEETEDCSEDFEPEMSM